MAKISVFGTGYVGVVSAACLAKDGHLVVAVDLIPERVAMINAGQSPIIETGLEPLVRGAVANGSLVATLDADQAVLDTDVSYVCVGTSSNRDGSVGLAQVTDLCGIIGRAIAAKDTYHTVIIRSTIVPGTMDEVCVPLLEAASGKKAGVGFGVGYYPEFLRENTAVADYYDPGLIVFGALDHQTFALLNLLNRNMPCVAHEVDLRTAEMVKYTSTAWRAVKVTFAHEIGNISRACGLDGQVVMKLLCSDDRANLSADFLRPGFALGGSCLPRDVRALRQLARAKDVAAPLMTAVLQANEDQIERAAQMVADTGEQAVGLVGISCQPGDDLRESPLAKLAARLIAKGLQVQVYDPNVSVAHALDADASGGSNDVIPDLRDRMVPSIEALIAGSGVILVGTSYAEAAAPLAAAMKDHPMVDLTRVPPSVVSDGTYQGIFR